MNNYDYLIKCIVIGDSFVGKTTLCNILVNNNIIDIYDATIGVDFYSTTKNINELNWKIHLWDTSGYSRFSKVIEYYYKLCAICIAIFDVTDYNSFIYINKKLIEIRNINPNIYILVIGNKIDLRDINKHHNIDYYISYYKEHNILYYDISIKNNIGISNLLESIINNFYNDTNIISNINGTTNITGLKTKPKLLLINNDNNNIFKDCIVRTNKLLCNII